MKWWQGTDADVGKYNEFALKNLFKVETISEKELPCNHGFGKTIIVEHGVQVLAYCSVCKSPVDI